jgi:putative spermidine/putrescine transport system permease protein
VTSLTQSEPASTAATTPPPVAGDGTPRGRGGDRSAYLLLLPAALLMLLVFAYPLFEALWRSLSHPQLGLQNYEWFFATPANIDILLRTLGIAAGVTLITLVLGYPYAYLMTISGPRARTVLTVLVMVPFWTSLMVRTFAWIILLQDGGVLKTLFLEPLGLGGIPLLRNEIGVLIGMSQVLLPFMVLPLANSMAAVDQRLHQAALSLGARPSMAFFRVFWPLAMPGVVAGSLLVFIQALGFYITPALLGSPQQMMISQYIYTQINQQLAWGRGSALGMVLLAATVILLVLMGMALRAGARRTGRKANLL